jgi:hypothetical protein
MVILEDQIMGQEIDVADRLDADVFAQHLRTETAQVMAWFKEDAFERPDTALVGLELEAWLLDQDMMPAPRNVEFLDRMDNRLVVPELSRFNFEFNAEPEPLSGHLLGQVGRQLDGLWAEAGRAAKSLDLAPMMVGMPATLREDMLTTEYMTPSKRYALLNERVFEMREGAPLKVDIDGRDSLSLVQDHLMLEAACTSLQIHLMVDRDNGARTYNAAQIASAPILAAGANSPFLYGRRLWEETRIPAFEAAVNLPAYRDRNGRTVGRVGFGSKHLDSSLLELFLENLDGFPPLLPIVQDRAGDPIRHLKLHNGTIWRWNRPIIGLNDAGTPHLRIENRVLPAGPTVIDIIANMAFFIGLTLSLRDEPNLEERLPFELARSNFYASARRGLGADIVWLDGQVSDVQSLIHGALADRALHGLLDAGIDEIEASHYIGIIKARALNGQTGAAWHRAHANCHGRDFQKLVGDYLTLQQCGQPVHTWTV